jgi:alpha-glucosidase
VRWNIVKLGYLSAILCGLAAAPGAAHAAAQWEQLDSPGHVTSVAFSAAEGVARYRATYHGRPVVDPSALGLKFKGQPAIGARLTVTSVERRSADSTWVQPWGEQERIRDNYNQMSIDLVEDLPPHRHVRIHFRAYDDGIAFRYEVPAQASIGKFQLEDELTEFVFAQNFTTWWIPALRRAGGEYQYARSALSSVKLVQTPLTMEGDGVALSIHEAALSHFAGMNLLMAEDNSRTLKVDLVPWSDGTKVRGATPLLTPWRTITLAHTAIELLDSTMNLNLADPNRLGDTSWIKPEKFIGIWWGMHIGEYTWSSGPAHGASTQRALQYIDWAADHRIPAVLFEGWNAGWDVGEWWKDGRSHFQFTQTQPDFDMDAVAKHASERGIEIVGHHETGNKIKAYLREMEPAFDYYERHGVHVVKMGHVGMLFDSREWPDSQYGIEYFEQLLQAAARHHIAIISHEPVKDGGLRRTYPNLLAREGARGQEYNGGSPDTGNLPDHLTILPFTRMLAGPFDYTPGVFNFHYQGKRPKNRVPGTLAQQLALFVVLYTPDPMACDLPENYEGQPAFKFIQDVATDWSESHALMGEIGEYVVIARKQRAGNQWFLGGITNDAPRDVSIPLGFLDPGVSYRAEVYADGPSADWRSAPEDVSVYTQTANQASTLRVRLASGGGVAVRLVPQ